MSNLYDDTVCYAPSEPFIVLNSICRVYDDGNEIYLRGDYCPGDSAQVPSGKTIRLNEMHFVARSGDVRMFFSDDEVGLFNVPTTPFFQLNLNGALD
jgi:hypothetical protein